MEFVQVKKLTLTQITFAQTIVEKRLIKRYLKTENVTKTLIVIVAHSVVVETVIKKNLMGKNVCVVIID